MIVNAQEEPANYKNFSPEQLVPYVEQKIAYLEFTKTTHRGVDEPARWLGAAIVKNYKEPHGYIPPELMAERTEQERNARAESLRLLREEQAAADAERARVAAEKAAVAHEQAALYGEVTKQESSSWGVAVMSMERHVHQLPQLLGRKNQHLTIGVSRQDMHFLSHRGSILIDRAVGSMKRDYGVETYALVELVEVLQ